MSKPLRPRRRSQAEARKAILSAATALFAERGYAGTTTRAIAQLADASEVLLYRYFNSKAELFEQAISEPFDELMDNAKLLVQGKNPGDVEFCRLFVRRLFNLLVEDKQLILAMITTRAYEVTPEDSEDSPRGLRSYFEKAERGVAHFYEEAGVDFGISPAMAARLAFASVTAAALLDDWLFDNVGAREDIVEGVVEFVTRAVYGPPVGQSADPGRYRRRRPHLRVAGGTYRRRR
jgi:AcrR family transcriptional regulator